MSDDILDQILSQKVCPECVQCGYCCVNNPCYYGEWNSDKTKCKYLTENYKCSKYEEIVEYENSKNFRIKLFGSGCCRNYLNPWRRKILKNNNQK